MSCEKFDDNYCYDCYITFYWQTSYGLFAKDDTVVKCESERNIHRFEKQRTTNPYPISACGDIRWSECKCIKR